MYATSPPFVDAVEDGDTGEGSTGDGATNRVFVVRGVTTRNLSAASIAGSPRELLIVDTGDLVAYAGIAF